MILKPRNSLVLFRLHQQTEKQIGQRVLLKHKQRMNGPMGPSAELTGIPVREGDETLYVYEQTNVVGIIAEPV